MDPNPLTTDSHKSIDRPALSSDSISLPSGPTGSSERGQRTNDGIDSPERSTGTYKSDRVDWESTESLINRPNKSTANNCQNRDKFYAWFTLDEVADLQLKFGSRLEAFWEARSDPPITQQSLSELDMPRIMENAPLRHDLNFEHDVSFRPNHHGLQGQKKLRDAEKYWEALTIELAVFFGRRSATRRSTLLPDSSWQLWRLPQMFKTLREILKTLVPAVDGSLVDQRLDVELLMQELDKGACDLIGLSEWLGELLRRSCSPMRDEAVLEVVRLMQEASIAGVARELVCAINNLFGVLETMKLDVANHQIRHLRLILVDDSIHFEQRYFLERIAEHEDFSSALRWYGNQDAEGLCARNGDKAQLKAFSERVVDIVIKPLRTPIATIAPKTCAFDVDRLQSLRVKFQGCIYQDLYIEAFLLNLRYLGYSGTPPVKICNDLLVRIINLADPRQMVDDTHNRVTRAALEVVRRAHELCNCAEVPGEATVQTTINFIKQAQNPDLQFQQDLNHHLSDTLQILVQQELETISELTPLQILNYYAHQRLPAGQYESQESLLNIAKQVAHITVLHWRIWGPILYQQSWKKRDERLPIDELQLKKAKSSSKQDNPKEKMSCCEIPRPEGSRISNEIRDTKLTDRHKPLRQMSSDKIHARQALKGCAAVGFFPKLYG